MEPGAHKIVSESPSTSPGALTTSSCYTSSQENERLPVRADGYQGSLPQSLQSSRWYTQQMAVEGSQNFVPELARLLAITLEKCERLERRNSELTTSEAKLRADLLECYCSKMRLMEIQSTLKDKSHAIQRQNARLKSELKTMRGKLRKQTDSTDHLKNNYGDVCRSKIS